MGHFFEVYPEYRVKWTVNVVSPHLSLDVETTTTVGLVVSETLTNILKHGFPGVQNPLLDLRLEVQGDDILLTMDDNGCSWNPAQSSSGLGMKIIHALARQLHGRVEWTSVIGRNTFLLTWPLHRTPTEEEPQPLEYSS